MVEVLDVSDGLLAFCYCDGGVCLDLLKKRFYLALAFCYVLLALHLIDLGFLFDVGVDLGTLGGAELLDTFGLSAFIDVESGEYLGGVLHC